MNDPFPMHDPSAPDPQPTLDRRAFLKSAAAAAGAVAAATTIIARAAETIAGSDARISVFDFMTTAQIADVKAGTMTLDLSTAMQSALDSLSAGGVLYFPPGAYKIDAGLTVRYAIQVLGAGRGKTIIRATTLGANKSAFTAASNNVSFRDFTLRGPSSAAYVAEEKGILFLGTGGAKKQGGSVDNVEVYNFGWAGILAEYYNAVTVTGCYVHDVGYVGIGGFSVDDFVVRGNLVKTITPGTSNNAYGIVTSARGKEAVPVRFMFDGNTVDGVFIWEGIDTHGGTDGVISNNIITNCSLGIMVGPAPVTKSAPSRIVISGNSITKGPRVAVPARGIGSGGHDQTKLADSITVTGNTITDMGYVSSYRDGAMMFQYTSNLVISNNAIVNSKATSLGLIDGNSKFSVTGNTIGTVQAGHANASGIVINSPNQTGVVSGNNITVVAGKYGIYMVTDNPGVALDNNQITGTRTPYINPHFARLIR